jgi:hypothetical protein
MGLLDHASWNAGISGGSWYVSAHTLASLQRTDHLADPAAVLASIKERIQHSMFGDYFEANEVCTCVYVCLCVCVCFFCLPYHQLIESIRSAPPPPFITHRF